MTDLGNQSGVRLAHHLALSLEKQEGHDLAGPCIECNSSDAFRLHMETGVAQCYSCQGKWSPFQLAERVTGDREQAKAALVDAGLFHDGEYARGPLNPIDPIAHIAQQKHVSANALRDFGGKAAIGAVRFPCYGADGHECTTFTILTSGGKGLFAKGKPAGLFFPHINGRVRLPKEGESWHLVEGVKDSAALHGLGLLACGLNTCCLAAKFARLFRGTDIVLVPDRDRAGMEGAEHSARVLHGFAKSVRIAILPAESKESNGDDVRDILRLKNGHELLQQAIADARPPDGWEASQDASETNLNLAGTTEIELQDRNPLKLEVSYAGNKSQRVVIASCGEIEHRDHFNTNSNISRERFIRKVAQKLDLEYDTLAPLIEPQLFHLAEDADSTMASDGGETLSQATIAANIALAWDLWHSPGQEGFVTIPVEDHHETWPIRSQTFKRFLAMRFFEDEGSAINSESLSTAINLIEAKALFGGQEHAVFVRVAGHNDNIYLDLCNNKWQVVEITSLGWSVIDASPVRFRRSRGMLPPPIPVHGGSVDLLRDFVHVDDESWQLIVAWLVAALRPVGPYPVLALFAEQGSGKSTIGRLLRSLIDPNKASLRADPSDCHDLMITASNSWCLAYDNLSHVRTWLSDALCRISTGGGFSTRELYTDQEEIIFDSQRPVLLTSIEEVATRSDLLDRCLVVQLPTIREDQRRPEAELYAAFEEARPAIFGALLDGVATAIQRLPMTKLNSLPRMADFATWVTAAECSFGWESGTFLKAYQGNKDSANDIALDASAVSSPLLKLLSEEGGWNDTASSLLEALESRVTDQVKRQKVWPNNPRSLSGHLKRLAPNLRAAGWQVTFHRQAKQRYVTIDRVIASSSTVTVASPPTEAPSVQTDAIQCKLFPNDANDGCDANDGESEHCVRRNNGDAGWEDAATRERCSHADSRTWVDDPPAEGRIRTCCRICGDFIGYRSAER